MNDLTLFFICFCLLIGAVGKSAQLGLHTWLPDAMEGPNTSLCSYTCSYYGNCRSFSNNKDVPSVWAFCHSFSFNNNFSSLTAFFAATVGLVQNDLKKVIAYSTCSQLGYMVMICGFSNYQMSLFHLFNHAFFKALLFLSAGSVIHSLMDEQDMRKIVV